MIFALALIPAIALLVYIYKKDSVEKEPASLLMKCVGYGALSTVPAIVLELLLEFFCIDAYEIRNGSVPYALIMGFIVAGLTEESCKFYMLRKATWNSKHFDYMFDGIVYGVYVSLGFAALENLFYVVDGGVSTALMRMFTAIPGHTCFGVYMGYHYSIAKKASIAGDQSGYKKSMSKALIIPMICHGFYDALLMTTDEGVGEVFCTLCMLVWIALVIFLFRKTFKFVNLASRHDYGFYGSGRWKCPKCGRVAEDNFCGICGTGRTEMDIEKLAER